MLLMSLMEESTQEADEYYGDDRLVSMIQSLEAEISYDMGHVDGQDCSNGPDHLVDNMELMISSSPFDEMGNDNAWIPCGGDEMDVAMEYEGADENIIDDFQMCYGVFLEQHHRETYYLSQGPSDAVF